MQRHTIVECRLCRKSMARFFIWRDGFCKSCFDSIAETVDRDREATRSFKEACEKEKKKNVD